MSAKNSTGGWLFSVDTETTEALNVGSASSPRLECPVSETNRLKRGKRTHFVTCGTILLEFCYRAVYFCSSAVEASKYQANVHQLYVHSYTITCLPLTGRLKMVKRMVPSESEICSLFRLFKISGHGWPCSTLYSFSVRLHSRCQGCSCQPSVESSLASTYCGLDDLCGHYFPTSLHHGLLFIQVGLVFKNG